MATFYVGARPVLKGRDADDMINVFKGTAGTYSFYPFFAKGLLDGAPDNHHVPGTGYHPGNVFLSQLFNGTTLYASTTPLAGTFADGAGYEGARFKPKEFKGLSASLALDGGHAKRSLYYGVYSNFVFDGVTAAEVMPSGFGHGPRTEAQGAPNSFGVYRPDEFNGVTSAVVFTSGYGQANTESDYGRSKVLEYKGLDSTKAL
jgi:hypothetical protein